MKVSVVFMTSRSFWPLPASMLWMLTITLGLSIVTLSGVSQVRADDAAEEDEIDKLIGLLDAGKAKPLMTPAQEKDFRGKRERSYRSSALKALAPNSKEAALIREGAQFRVHRLTMPSNWPNIANRTKELVTDLDGFAEGSPRAREMLLKAAVKELDALLFSDQPAFVKINATWLLGRLNVINNSVRTKTPAVPYAPAAEPLVKVLEDSNLPVGVKVVAVRGVGRILQDGDPTRQLRDKIAKALADQLNAIENNTSGEGRDWYQWRLVDALGTVEFPRSMTQQTYVVDALWKTMHDETLPWHIRTRAARSLGQLKLDASFNVHLLVHEIVLLAGRVTFAYNQNPNLSQWPLCFSDLYFAFKAKTQRQHDRGWGLLKNPPVGAKKAIEGAYAQVLPLVNGMLEHEPRKKVPGSLLKQASEWRKANPPPNLKIHQGAAPLNNEKQPAAPVGGDSGVLKSQQANVPV